MHRSPSMRSPWVAGLLVACIAACSGERRGGAMDGGADAGRDGGGFDAAADAGDLDGGAPDTGVPDTGVPDTGTPDAGAPDASRDAGTPDTGTPDAGASDAGDGGTPSGTLLVTDVGENAVYHLELDGTEIDRFTPAVSQIRGVSFDRTSAGGFWVSSDGSSTITVYRCDWSGTVVDTVDSGRSTMAVYGADAWINDSGDQEIAVMNLNSASVDVVSSVSTTGELRSSAGHVVSGSLATGFWGTDVVGWTSGGTLRWVTRESTATLKHFSVATETSSASLPFSEPRGVARTPSGDFYVVDQAGARIVLVDATGTVLDSFETPGTQPAGISYSE